MENEVFFRIKNSPKKELFFYNYVRKDYKLEDPEKW